MFDDDDDDVLGGMGLESPPGQKKRTIEKKNEEDSSSFLASLGIGRSSSAEKPGSASKRPETFFDRMEKKATSGAGASARSGADILLELLMNSTKLVIPLHFIS